jgi:hypothetical protein
MKKAMEVQMDINRAKTNQRLVVQLRAKGEKPKPPAHPPKPSAHPPK